MAIAGSGVKDPNFVLRFSSIVFFGVLAFGAVLFWRSSLIFASEYQDVPVSHEQVALKNRNEQKQKRIAKGLSKTIRPQYPDENQ